ncbi:MAG: Dps family protein [Salibacteraceae bacterium]
MKNRIGIEEEKAAELATRLNALLANYQLYYQNLRGFHWNISGNAFFELHQKFEELYTDANNAVDEIAERILTLGHTPLHTFADYLENATISPAKDMHNGTETVTTTVENLSTLVGLERELLDLSAEANDEGTNSLMSDYINAQEKTIWMLSAYLGK